MPVSDERREQRKKEAQKHVGLMRGVFGSDIAATVEAAVVYEDGEGRALELPEAAFESTETQVTTDFAPAALQRVEGKAALIDPCSFTRPGGNYLEGSFGPEQIICADSDLYPVLCDLKKRYHDGNRGYAVGQLFTDRALYLPDVVFNRNGEMRKADVIALPEPNFARAKENNRGEAERNQAIENRINTFLNIAAANGCETVICGAFGCGRQGYPTDQVISIFQAWLAAHPGGLKAIVFAVPRAQFDAFDKAFGQPAPMQPEPEATAEEDADEPDIHDIDLPEGVTLR
ncbi:MAG: TIGR02452 family protein [Eggerthellaceae bacterium]|jgi:uncharacterized protein (TIGR02452 family)